jgi:hypothetical protein
LIFARAADVTLSAGSGPGWGCVPSSASTFCQASIARSRYVTFLACGKRSYCCLLRNRKDQVIDGDTRADAFSRLSGSGLKDAVRSAGPSCLQEKPTRIVVTARQDGAHRSFLTLRLRKLKNKKTYKGKARILVSGPHTPKSASCMPLLARSFAGQVLGSSCYCFPSR